MPSATDINSPRSRRAMLKRERDADRHARAIDRYLAANFSSLSEAEREEVRQDAFLALETRIAAGGKIVNAEAFLITCARHAAVKRFTSSDHRRRHTFDPHDSPEARMPDASRDVEARVIEDDEDRRVWRLIDEMGDREREVLRLRFAEELDGPEIAKRIGLQKSHAYTVLREAGHKLYKTLEAERAGTRTAAHRALLTACAMGVATDDQRRRAERLLEEPHARALLAELRGLGQKAAALMPAPPVAAVEHRAGRLGELVTYVKQQAAEMAESTRQHVTGLAGRATGQEATTQLASAGGVRGSGTAVMLVAACIGGGVGAKECIDAGVPRQLVDAIPGVVEDRPPDDTPAAPVDYVPLNLPSSEPAPEVVQESEPAPAPEPVPADPAPAPPTASDSISGLSGTPTAPAPPATSSPSGGGSSGSSGTTFGGL